MNNNEELNEQFFATPFWATEKPEWVEHLNKISQSYLDETHEKHKEGIEKNGGSDFGRVYHSTALQNESEFLEFGKYITNTGFSLLETWGVDMSNFDLGIHSMWVQEFAKDGGGHHRVHIHENCHISGFFFLENDNSSYPLFHDPRPGAAMTALPEKDIQQISYYSKCINYQPKPGSIYMFPSYLPHEYVMSRGGNFKFIHWNLMALPRNIVMAEGSV